MFYWTKVLVVTLQVVVFICLIPGMLLEKKRLGKLIQPR